ncbi:hypothetical protein QET93_006395 [Akkermansia sp. N21116]|uniref:hypothetical protein n=1 Tax=Akkermansia sp. N21116 TaxID=3040764 RepID=UPI00244EA85D|nr:hypothetical protein [Akkermansia sp. N21116]WPX41723.1 hypothetical protein QET93_006395 [Akkermansia sp. N21116]
MSWADMSPSVEKMTSSYIAQCNDLSAPVVAEYRKKLQDLMIKSIESSDFTTGKRAKIALAELDKNPGLLLESDSFGVSGWWLEVNRDIFHKLVSGGVHYQIKGKGNAMQSGDVVDTDSSLGDVIVFKSSCNRVWVRYDQGKMCQFTKWSLSRMEKTKSGTQDVLWALRSEFSARCARICTPLSVKYIQSLHKARKQEISRGNLDAALAIHRRIEKEKDKVLSSTAASAREKWPDSRLAGLWKEADSGCSYRIDSSRTISLYNENGETLKEFSYVKSSEHGNVHTFLHSSGEVRIFAIAGDCLYVFIPASGWRTTATKVP